MRRQNSAVHVSAGLLGHPKRAIAQPALHVFTGTTVCCEFEVMDGRCAIQGDVRYDAALDPGPNQRPQPDLDDMAPKKEHDSSAGTPGHGDCVYDTPEVLRGEYVGQAGEKCRER